MLGAPDWALDDEMVTMRPQPAAIMSGTASCMQVKVPVRLTAMIRSHFSGVMSATGSNASMPALVTTMVIGPNSLAHRGVGSLERRRGRPRRPRSPRRGSPCADSSAAASFGRVTVAVEQRDGMAVRGQPPGDAQADARGAHRSPRRPGRSRAASAGVNSMCRLRRPRRTQVGS